MAKYKRRIKLIKPLFQNQLTLAFMGMSALGIAMQFLLFHATLGTLAAGLPSDGAILLEDMNGALLGVLAITLAAILPLTYIVGILTTFRVAGPLYRVERHLAGIVKEGYQGPCSIRKSDKLHSLVDVLNQATVSLAAGEPIALEATDSRTRKAA